MISDEVMYKSIRQEILDQKKCQFNLFGACLTITAAILAYASKNNVGPIVFIAPIILNVLGVTIILDKAKSIQRMVGYLQLMENEGSKYKWMWEYHLSKFREIPGKSVGFESFRRHSYIITVASFLLLINIFCASLYYYGPNSVKLRLSTSWPDFAEFYGMVDIFVILFLIIGFVTTIKSWIQLIFGQHTNKAIIARWKKVI